ncbi:MAG: metallophosphoesterase [Planctomycetes bacterium]|nr:metallophosphoesterase [Planctomycetota bacterium]
MTRLVRSAGGRYIPAMPRLPILGGAIGAAVFAWIFAAACCSVSVPPIPDGTMFEENPVQGRLIVYGDSRPAQTAETLILGRRDPVEERRLVIEQIAAEAPDLVIHSGDFVARGADAEDWSEWARNHRLLAAERAFYPALGNHEYRGGHSLGRANFHRRFPRLDGRHWYSVRYGPLLFVILDSNFDEIGGLACDRQDRWLERTLQEAERESATRAVILVCHHPPYTNSTVHGPSEEVRRRFVDPARKCGKFRALFAGHVHNYERFHLDGIHYVVSGGGGAPQTSVFIGERVRTLPVYEGPELRPFHYLLLRLEGTRVEVDVMMLQADRSWSPGDRFHIEL